MRNVAQAIPSQNKFETFFAAVSSMAANPSLPADTFRQCVLDLCGNASAVTFVPEEPSVDAYRVKVRLKVPGPDGQPVEQVTTLHFSKDFFDKLVKQCGSLPAAREQIRKAASQLPLDVAKRQRSEEVRRVLTAKLFSTRAKKEEFALQG